MNLRKNSPYATATTNAQGEEPETFTVAIRFAKDAHLMTISGVRKFGVKQNAPNIAYIVKDGRIIYFNMNELLYIGHAEALGDGGRASDS